MNKTKKAMRDAFLGTLIHEMQTNDKIFFVTADFGSPVLDEIQASFPDRFLNVGIAEQNLINISTGLALEGFTVYAYAIAPFITMRCYEQIRVNLAIMSQIRKMNVNLVGVGAGYSYVVSGPTHQCLEDLSIMRTLPNIEVLSPCDWKSAQDMVKYSLSQKTVKYLRLDAQPLENIYTNNLNFSHGFCELKKGSDICLVSTGYMTQKAVNLKHKTIGIIDIFNLQNLDEVSLFSRLKKYSTVISLEEGFINKGGLDSLLLSIINKFSLDIKLINLGLDDKYNFELGDREKLHTLSGCGLDTINKQIEDLI